MKVPRLLPILSLVLASTLFASNSPRPATDQECHAAVNADKLTSAVITRQLKDGTNYGEETCGYVYQGQFTSLYWMQGGKGACEIMASDYDDLTAGKADGKSLEADCDAGKLPLVTLHPMPGEESKIAEPKTEVPQQCRSIKNKDGSMLLVCECTSCGKEEAKDGPKALPYHCEILPAPDTGKDAMFCGYDSADWESIRIPIHKDDKGKL